MDLNTSSQPFSIGKVTLSSGKRNLNLKKLHPNVVLARYLKDMCEYSSEVQG